MATRRLRPAALALLSVAVVLGFAPEAHGAAGAVGDRAPAFEAVTPEEHRVVSLAAQRGRAVLLNKWSTWCRPCVAEMPFLQALHERHRAAGFAVIGVSIDRPGTDRNVLRVAARRGATYPMWLDPQDDFTSTFRSTGVPESVLIDRRGVVVRRWPGALDEGDPTIDAAIRRAVSASGDYRASAARDVEASGAVSFGLLGLLAAVAAGLLSFLSPCVLPLVPSYVAFLSGVGGADRAGPRRAVTMTHAVAFVLGFSVVFVLLGLSATAVGGAVRDSGEWLSRISGGLLIAFGLVLLGLVPWALLQRDVRLLDRARSLRRLGPVGSGVVGAAFGAGWTPCIGPVLAGILALAATGDSTAEGVALLGAYSAGLAVPFLAAAFALERFRAANLRLGPLLPWVNRASGALLIALGALLVTGEMTRLSSWLSGVSPSWLG